MTQYRLNDFKNDYTIMPLAEAIHEHLEALDGEELEHYTIRMLQEWVAFLAKHPKAAILERSERGYYSLHNTLGLAERALSAAAKEYVEHYYSQRQGGRMKAEEVINNLCSGQIP